jgi:tetratricopeptide (TPR) repeat protein/energy-coupling factor transporter ATP-binding protein EcfA2
MQPGELLGSTGEYIISDEPALDDRFGPHSRIAEAISKLVNGSPGHGRCIALTGPWGSGKSTVIRQLEKILDGQAKPFDPRPRVFLFDAWTYQGDPLRRCFLECLISFADKVFHEEEKHKEQQTKNEIETWLNELNTITGRREVTKASAKRPLDNWAVIFAISLLVLPIAGSFLGKYDTSKYNFFRNPFVRTALALYLIPLFSGIMAFRKGFGQGARVIIRDLHQDTETVAVKTREASSTDFQKLFAKIATALLENHKRRLVIVIDNLDRIDAANAVSMWTTMRTFFEFAGEEWNRRVWLIVPFDRSALRKLWKTDAPNDNREEELLDSFLSKTFQIVFHVSPPLFTELRAYFEEQMNLVFDQDTVTKQFDDVYRIYRLLGPASPSPRNVKSFLNKLRTESLLWSSKYRGQDLTLGERVLLPCLAVHALKVNDLADDPAALIKEDFLDVSITSLLVQALADAKSAARAAATDAQKPEIDMMFGDWRQQIAAAHFYVPPRDALQPILFGHFSKAFQAGDYSELERVQEQPYFPIVLKAYADGQRVEWRRDPAQLNRVVVFVSRADGKWPAADAADIWQNLVNDAAEVTSWNPLDQDRLQGIGHLMRHDVDATKRQNIARNVLASATQIDTGVPVSSWVKMLDGAVSLLNENGLSGMLHNFSVPFTHMGLFVEAQLEVIRFNPSSLLRTMLIATDHVDALPAAFATHAEKLDVAEFTPLREAVAGPLGGYDLLNNAVLDSTQLTDAKKADLLFQRPMSPEAELKPASLTKMVTVPHTVIISWDVAAVLILAQDKSIETGYGGVKNASRSSEDIAEIAGLLLKWKRGEVICDETWWDTTTGSLLPRLLEWVVANNRAAELPIAPLARLFPAILSSLPNTSGPLLNAVAARPDLVEALASMPSILETPVEIDFFQRLLPLIPSERKSAVSVSLAKALAKHVSKPEWLQVPGLLALLNEICSHAGASWLPQPLIDSWTPSQLSSMTRLNEALAHRKQWEGKTTEDLLQVAEDEIGASRKTLLDAARDRMLADRITGVLSETDYKILLSSAEVLDAWSAPWISARQTAAAIEKATTELPAAEQQRPDVQILRGSALLLAAARTDDRESIPLLREAGKAFGSVVASARAAQYLARQLISLAPRTSTEFGRVMFDLASTLLDDPEQDHRRDRVGLDLVLARLPFEDPSTAKTNIATALQLVTAMDPPTSRHRLTQARLLLSRAELEAVAPAIKTLEQAKELLQSDLVLNPNHYSLIVASAGIDVPLAALQPETGGPALLVSAESVLRRAIALDPDCPDAYQVLLRVMELKAQHDKGPNRRDLLEEAWKEASAALHPDRFANFATVHRRAARIRAMQARVPALYASAGTFAFEAAQQFSSAASLSPGDAPTVENWGHLLVQQARTARLPEAEKMLSEAIAKFEAALKFRPGYKWALKGWADALALRAANGSATDEPQTSELAIQKYQEALDTDPEFHAAMLGRAQVNDRLARLRVQSEAHDLLAKAKADVLRASEPRLDSSWVWRVMGRLEQTEGDRDWMPEPFERSLQHYRLAAELRTDEPGIPLSIADVLRVQANLTGKAELLDEALAIYRSISNNNSATHGWALSGIGFALGHKAHRDRSANQETRLGLLAESRKSFEQAVELRPDNVAAKRGLAWTLRRLALLEPSNSGELQREAEVHLASALQIRGGDPDTLAALGDLYREQASSTPVTAQKLELLSKAGENYHEALVTLQDHFGALYGAGLGIMEIEKLAPSSNNLERAAQHFEAALLARPGDLDARQQLDYVRKLLAFDANRF